MALNVEIRRPGRARSRLEALTYAKFHKCPSCGRPGSPTVSRPADPMDGGFWEVISDCPNCGTVTRNLFEEGPGWPGGLAHRGGPGNSGDPAEDAPRMAETEAATELFTADELAEWRDRGEFLMARLENRPEPPDGPDQTLLRLRAMQALVMLRPMLELERLASLGQACLPDDHDALRARLAAHATAAGIAVPDREG